MMPAVQRRWRIAPRRSSPCNVAGGGGRQKARTRNRDGHHEDAPGGSAQARARGDAGGVRGGVARVRAHQGRHREEFVRLEGSRSARSRTCGSDSPGRRLRTPSGRSASGAPSRKIWARARTSGRTRAREWGGINSPTPEGRPGERRHAVRLGGRSASAARGGELLAFFCKTRDRAYGYVRSLARSRDDALLHPGAIVW